MAMAILGVEEYHEPCGKKLETRPIHISVEGYDNSNYPVNFCPNCKVFMYHHGEDGMAGIESVNPHDVESYINKLILKGKN
jgi:hypothetical protein